MPYDDEMQVSLHPKMAAWLQNELENGSFDYEEDGDDQIIDDTLKQLQPAPEPSAEEARAKKGEQVLRAAREKLHATQTFLNLYGLSLQLPFHEIDAAHGILQDEMIPMTREHQALTEQVNRLTDEIDLLHEEVRQAEGERKIQENRYNQLIRSNENLRQKERIALERGDKAREEREQARKDRDEMWAVLGVDNQTDATKRLRNLAVLADRLGGYMGVKGVPQGLQELIVEARSLFDILGPVRVKR